MKKLTLLLSLSLLPLLATAQQPSTIFTNFVNFLLVNPSNTVWQTSKMQLEVGSDYQNNLQWAADIRAGYNFIPQLQVNAEIVNAGIAGVVEAYQGGLSYGYINNSLKIELGGDLGYDHQYNSGVGYPFVKIEKSLPNNQNMYTFFEVGEPIYFKHQSTIPNPWVPSIRIGVGVSF